MSDEAGHPAYRNPNTSNNSAYATFVAETRRNALNTSITSPNSHTKRYV
jgi:hypothetical protein